VDSVDCGLSRSEGFDAARYLTDDEAVTEYLTAVSWEVGGDTR
jgi:DNA-binding phage protein